MIDFSVNVTPLGIPDNIRRAMEESLSRAGWYPDDSKRNLKEVLNKKHGVPVENICVGNGASDVIFGQFLPSVRNGRLYWRQPLPNTNRPFGVSMPESIIIR